MGKKKQLIEESFNKMRNILESRLHEAPAAAAPAAPAAQSGQAAPAAPSAAPAAAPEQDQQKAQQLAKATEVEMDNAMKIAVGNIDDILQKIVTTQGDKDGQIDAPGQEQQAQGQQPKAQQAQGQQAQAQGQQIKESSKDSGCLRIDENKLNSALEEELQTEAVGMLAGGIALSAPTITKWIGKGIGALGKKVDSNRINTWGEKLAKFGEKWHHAYINTIAMAVAKFYPANAQGVKPDYKDPGVQKVANVIFMSIVAAMGAGAASGAAHAAQTGQTALAAVEGGLAGVKGFESAETVLKGIAPLLKSMGIG